MDVVAAMACRLGVEEASEVVCPFFFQKSKSRKDGGIAIGKLSREKFDLVFRIEKEIEIGAGTGKFGKERAAGSKSSLKVCPPTEEHLRLGREGTGVEGFFEPLSEESE